MSSIEILDFFHDAALTASHAAIDAARGEAALVDPVLDFEPADGL